MKKGIFLAASFIIICNMGLAEDWQEEANARIEKIRKGNTNVKLTFDNKELSDVSIRYEMVRHSFPFGSAISFGGRNSTPQKEEMYRKLFIENFNSAVSENHMKWQYIARKSGEPNFDKGDEIVEFCKKNNLGLRGHCLVWERDKFYPGWVKLLKGEELRKEIKSHIQSTVKHFGDYIREWDVNNEPLHCTFVQEKLGKEILVDMHKFVEEVDSEIRLYVNEYDEYNPKFRKELIEKVKWMVKNGAKVDGIGLQCHFERMIPGGVENMKSYIEEISNSLNLPVKLTEFDINNSPNEQMHAKALENFYRMAFSLPQVEGIWMWGFWEGRHWKPRASIYREDFSPKKAANRYRRLVFKEWWTKGEAKTDKNGEFKFRGFYGDYKVIVKFPDGKTADKTFKVIPGQEKYIIEINK